MSRILIAAALAATVTPAMAPAQTLPAPPAAAPAANPAAPADPARVAAAERAVAALVPQGIYARMMRDQFPQMMDAMMVQMMGMKGSDLGATGADAGQSLGDMSKAADPAFAERMRITTRVMSEELGKTFSAVEPRVRAGLARAFMRRFTTAQLTDMNAFFATPSGKAFADNYLLLFADPEMMREIAAATPEIMRAMPAIMARVEKETAHLPPPPKPKTPQ